MNAKPSSTRPFDLTLVVLAAGRSSRFGRPKTLEPVGPSGEVLFEYAICDAVRAGCERVVFVVSAEGEGPIMDRAVSRAGRAVRVDRVVQTLDVSTFGRSAAAPPQLDGRVKPWGTGHAVLALRREISTPFVVVNADDFYGPRAVESFAGRVRDALARGDDGHFLGAYELGRTGVSRSSGVNRGILAVGPDETLQGIHEAYNVRVDLPGLRCQAFGGEILLAPEARCTMNLWAFQPSIFPWLAGWFLEFLGGLGLPGADPPAAPAPPGLPRLAPAATPPAGRSTSPRPSAAGKSDGLPGDEFLLSETVGALAEEGAVRVRLIEMKHDTAGLTRAADLPSVAATLSGVVEAGAYPADLGRWFEGRARCG